MDQPTRIGKYLVLNRLGTGGMAEVFRCKLSGVGGFEKLVVVKRILPHLVEDDAFVRMFLDEARIAANLNHPNIVQVYEIAQDDDGTPYIAMEFVRGPTLSQLIKRVLRAGDMHFGRLARLVAQAAAGLDHAHHAKGPDGKPLLIVHRDVSPQNILVSTSGTAKILDFGVARAEGRLTHTQGATLKGKLRYMPPEMVSSGGQDIDLRIDVYALGVTLYVGTVGQLPYDAPDDTALMKSIVAGQYPPPSSIRPDYPPELEKLVAWGMHPDLAQRCPTARAFSDALLAFAATQPASGEPDIAQWVTRHFPEVTEDAWGSAGRSPSGISRPSIPSPAGTTRASNPAAEPAPSEVAIDVDLAQSVISPSPAPPAMPADASSPGLPAPRSRRGPGLLVAALAGLVVVAGAGFLVTNTGTPEVPAPRVEAPPPAPDPVGPLLDQAESALAEGKLYLAGQLVEAAQGRPRSSAEDARLVQAAARVSLARRLAEARQAVDAAQVERAAALLDALLVDHSSDADVMALKGRLEALRAPVDAGVSPTPAAPSRGRGSVRVLAFEDGEPTWATLTVDGKRVEKVTPVVVELSAGKHQLLLERPGFDPVTRTVVVGAGRTEVVRFDLAH